MICPRGHGFDGPLDSKQCPICGVELETGLEGVDRFFVGRKDLTIIRDGLAIASRILFEMEQAGLCAFKDVRKVEDAKTRLEVVRQRARYGKRMDKVVDMAGQKPDPRRVSVSTGQSGNQTQKERKQK